MCNKKVWPDPIMQGLRHKRAPLVHDVRGHLEVGGGDVSWPPTCVAWAARCSRDGTCTFVWVGKARKCQSIKGNSCDNLLPTSISTPITTTSCYNCPSQYLFHLTIPNSPIFKKRRLPFRRTAILFKARRKPRPRWFVQYKRAFGGIRRLFTNHWPQPHPASYPTGHQPALNSL